jgi:hypothetical protein
VSTDTARPAPAPETPTLVPEVVPLAYVGKWIAWSADGMRILSIANTLDEVERLAQAAGEALSASSGTTNESSAKSGYGTSLREALSGRSKVKWVIWLL